MKRVYFGLFTVALLALASVAAFAGTAELTKTDVPFAFYAGDQLMPAGSYIVQVDDNHRQLLLRAADGSTGCMLLAQASNDGEELSPAMVFDRLGNSYFLRAVKDSVDEFDIAPSKTEKNITNERSIAQISLPAHGI